MPSKKVKKAQASQTDKIIQYVAIAVILVIAVMVALPYLQNLPANEETVATEAPIASAAPAVEAETEVPVVATEAPAQEASASAESASDVCAEFSSIPTAEKYQQPPMKVDEAKQYFANFKMAKGGEFVVQLYPDKAPITVNSFVFLTCKGFFNGVTFHRVLDGFMAQGGDPTGTGTSGPGYEFVNEDSDLTFDKAGVVAMANAGRDTNGSQFFITFAPADFLNGGYTIFGQVVEGMDVVNGITRRDPQGNPAFEGDAMETVTILEK